MQSFSKEYKEIKCLPTVIDVFSKYVWIIPLKRKTGQKVTNAFSRILKERRPGKMWVYKGKKLYNRDVQILVEPIL